MPELLVHGTQGEIRLSFTGQPLLHTLIASLPDAPTRDCGGAGTCGKCAVYARGSFSPAADTDGRVLSCQTRVTGAGEIWLPRRQQMTQIEMRTRSTAQPLLPVPGAYAAAVDLGTTTLALRLLRLSDGQPLAALACENPQRAVAADVIGRIDSALRGNLPLLTGMIRQRLDALEQEAIAQAGLSIAAVDARVVAGNTTMLYLYTGRNPETLSHAPFAADCLFGLQAGRDWLPPCAGAFVGADITCAILASGMCQKDETALLMDIGTNGEIALWHQGVLTCCATAAGPAFEGAGISCGTGSIPGAIDRAWVDGGSIAFSTIDGAPVSGICGSGLMDVVAALLETGQLDETGALDEEEITLAPGARVTRRDVRQVQLAKGAVAAGVETLVRRAGLSFADVDALYIAGGFGSHLNLSSAARIGLIPAALEKRAVVLGNASLSGAEQLLLHAPSRSEAARLAAGAQCLNLGGDPGFTQLFAECMLFE